MKSLAVLGRTAVVLVVVSVAGFVLTLALRVAGANEVAVFVVAAVTLGALAGLVGEATDELGSRLGPASTGVLQSALGNLPELFISLFALRAGLVVLVQTALIGSILANSLLVLGLAFLAGGWRYGLMRFNAAPTPASARTTTAARNGQRRPSSTAASGMDAPGPPPSE